MKERNGWLLFIFIILLSSCAGQKKLLEKKSPLIVPAGVDSTIAKLADSTANDLFVSFKQEDEATKLKETALNSMAAADTAWKFLKVVSDTSQEITQEQRQRAIDQFNLGALNIKRITEIEQRIETQGLHEKTIAELKKTVSDLLKDARQNFEAAIRLNPFDLEARDALAWVLWKVADHFDSKENYEDLIDVLTELIHLDKGEHQLYFRLGRAFFEISNWDSALSNFKKAEKMLRDYAMINAPDPLPANQLSSEDSLNLYTYLYYQANTYVEQSDAKHALECLNTALGFSESAAQKKSINEYKDWINWDNGNIKASKFKDEILSNYTKDMNHKNAERQLIKLLNMVSKQQAIDEVAWRIARIEFSALDKTEQGISRLSKVVFNAKKDSSGCPVDTTYKRYFEDFAIMCNNIAIHNLTGRISRKRAYTYFLQAVQICSSIRGKLYVELVKLSKNNPDNCIQYCFQTFTYLDPRDTKNIAQLMKYLTNSYRRLAQRDKVTVWYNIWKNLKSQQWENMYFAIANELLNEPEACIKWSKFTLENYQAELSKKETEQIYALIINSYKNLNNQERINYWYKQWQIFKGVTQ